jgi:hypothetical protein
MAFNPNEHLLVMERKQKKKTDRGEVWVTVQTEYLPVAWRLVWFRQENPKGKVDSTPVTIDQASGFACFECYVEREDGGSARMHGSETAGDWKDYIEKAQTKAVGRALAALGYGTQFTDQEFDEGERIVDIPITKASSSDPRPVAASSPSPAETSGVPVEARVIEGIRKLSKALTKAEPDYSTLNSTSAKTLLSQLTNEYRAANARSVVAPTSTK